MKKGRSRMKIRKARAGEIAQIMKLYDQARGFMRTTGNASQWVNGYPSVDTKGQFLCVVC